MKSILIFELVGFGADQFEIQDLEMNNDIITGKFAFVNGSLWQDETLALSFRDFYDIRVRNEMGDYIPLQYKDGYSISVYPAPSDGALSIYSFSNKVEVFLLIM